MAKTLTITPEARLNKLAALRNKLADADASRIEEIKKIIPGPIRAKIEEIEKAFQEKKKELEERMAMQEESIKDAVIESGRTAKGEALMAVYYAPRVTWDGKKLEALAAAYPAINVAKTVAGNASCAIRKI